MNDKRPLKWKMDIVKNNIKIVDHNPTNEYDFCIFEQVLAEELGLTGEVL